MLKQVSVLAVALILMAGCGADPETSSTGGTETGGTETGGTETGGTETGGTETGEQERKIVYSITGQGVNKADITFSYQATTSPGEESAAALPWTKEVAVKGAILPMVSAIPTGEDTDVKLACKITVDGKVISEQASDQGGIGVVSCSADTIM